MEQNKNTNDQIGYVAENNTAAEAAEAAKEATTEKATIAKGIAMEMLLQQRGFIMEQLEAIKNRPDGNPGYSYFGDVFFDNLDFFRSQGFEVLRYDPCAESHWQPVFFFQNNVRIMEGDMSKVSQYNPKKAQDILGQLAAKLFDE